MAIPKGDIHLLSNVPLTASYEHTIDFKKKDEQFSYFLSFRKTVLNNYSYIRKEREYIAVELPLSILDDINYLLFRSSEDDRLYYAFVTDKVYINPTTSHVFYTIDVMQTYMFDYEWRASYIQQAHVDRWTAEHKPIYSKTEEGLAYGNEYAVESAYKLQQSTKLRWFLVALKDYSEVVEEGHITEMSVTYPVVGCFSYLLVPFYLNDPKVATVNVESIEDVGTWERFADLMLNSAIGNYVYSINLLPYNPFVQSENEGSDGKISVSLSGGMFNTVTLGVEGANTGTYTFLLISMADYDRLYGHHSLANTEWNTGLTDSLPTADQWEEIKANPRTTERDKRFESKLLCAPYRYNLLTDWKNPPVIFKNEYMTADQIEIKFSYALTMNAPFRYWIKDYKKDPEGRYTSLNAPLSSDMPIISDAYYTYMLENKNTIQANLTNSVISAGAGVISGAISGGGIGGVGGAIFGGVSGAVSGALNVAAQIRSENAKQAGLKAHPDSVIHSGDSSFNVNDKNTELTFYRMRVCCENEEILAEIFNMTGYKVNRVEIPNTRSRVRFNYIQTLGANIVGSFNQSDLLKIKEIYDKGITIWHYSEKDFNPLDYSYENIEVSLI